MTSLLKFSAGNAKLGQHIATFSLPAGHTCPGAHECMAKANRLTGKLTDGKDTEFRCFAASQEAMFSSVRGQRWDNFELLKGKTEQQMFETICESLPNATLIRVHVSGDFFSSDYFAAWMRVARAFGHITFYAYTKSVSIWLAYAEQHEIPGNFKLTASYGGRHDHLIDQCDLKKAVVVFSIEQAERLGLAIDHDDSLAYGSEASFALLLHGTQPKGSIAAKALSALKANGHKGYSRKAA